MQVKLFFIFNTTMMPIYVKSIIANVTVLHETLIKSIKKLTLLITSLSALSSYCENYSSVSIRLKILNPLTTLR